MRNRTIQIALIAAVAILLATSVFVVFNWSDELQSRDMGSRYHPVSIEGFSSAVDGIGIACGKFDVRKMKWGGITLGGFNVLEIENLCLTLHEGDQSARNVTSADRKGEKGALESKCIDLVSKATEPIAVVRALMPKDMKVSGIRINGIKIMKALAAKDPQPWLEASLVRNSGRDLRISGLVEVTDGVRHAIGEARLVVDNGQTSSPARSRRRTGSPMP